MLFQKENLDLVLVPLGLLIMFGYHLFLLYRYLHLPHTTVYGFINNDIRAWVDKMVQMESKNYAMSVINSNTSAATTLASVSLTLSALIGAWIANSNYIFESQLIYGDTRPATLSIKYVSLLICFILAFSCFVQSARCFVHALYLVSMPLDSGNAYAETKYVELPVIRGGDFWALGLRCLYFAINLLLWFFGPIPMFATSVIMVCLLHYLDSNNTPMTRHSRVEKPLVRL